MRLEEQTKDLFEMPEEYYLAHCISSDFALGAGIAKEFNRRFNMRNILKSKHTTGNKNYRAILEGRTFNLVTKDKYYNKPTYQSLEKALYSMKEQCIEYNINKIAMPRIGCGLDRLEWGKVKNIIEEIFKDIDNMEIVVCNL